MTHCSDSLKKVHRSTSLMPMKALITSWMIECVVMILPRIITAQSNGNVLTTCLWFILWCWPCWASMIVKITDLRNVCETVFEILLKYFSVIFSFYFKVYFLIYIFFLFHWKFSLTRISINCHQIFLRLNSDNMNVFSICIKEIKSWTVNNVRKLLRPN